MDDDEVDRIFTGELESLPKLSTKVVRIFTSSTFTDMLMERNTLMQFVYPRIKNYCREKHGIEFQVISIGHSLSTVINMDSDYRWLT